MFQLYITNFQMLIGNIVDLSDVTYKRKVKEQIKKIKKINLNKY